MTRDLELIRGILLEAERLPDPARASAIALGGWSPAQVDYHVRLLHQAGLVDAVPPVRSQPWRVRSLTWAGHELLDAVRSEGVWQRVADRLNDRGVTAPVSVIEQLAAQTAASMLGVR